MKEYQYLVLTDFPRTSWNSISGGMSLYMICNTANMSTNYLTIEDICHKMQFECCHELIPVTHFVVDANTIYFVQNRSIIGFDSISQQFLYIYRNEKLSGKISSLQLRNREILAASLKWTLTFDLDTGYTRFVQSTAEKLSDYDLILECDPLVKAREPCGCLFSCCKDYYGTGSGEILRGLQRNEHMLMAPRGPVFAISLFNNRIAFSADKTATFGVAVESTEGAESNAHIHFLARSYAVNEQIRAAGSENGELYYNGNCLQLYRAGVRGILDRFVLESNGAIFMLDPVVHESENVCIYEATQGEDLCVGGYEFSADGSIYCGETCLRHPSKNESVLEVCEQGNFLVCRHRDGSLSSNIGRFTPVHLVSQRSKLFLANNELFVAELKNDFMMVCAVFIERYGLISIFEHAQVPCEGAELQEKLDICWDNGILTSSACKSGFEFKSEFSLVVSEELAAKEFNCGSIVPDVELIFCGSEDGLLQAFDYDLRLLFSLDLHSSIKSMCLLGYENECLSLFVGCCQNKLFCLTFDVKHQRIILHRVNKCPYFRLTQNIKFNALRLLADPTSDGKALLVAGDASGWILLFFCAFDKFVFLEQYEVGFSVLGLEIFADSLIVSGSRGIVIYTIDNGAISDLLYSSEIPSASFSEVKHFQPWLDQQLLHYPVLSFQNEVIHMTSRGLLARDTGAPFELPSGVLACLRTRMCGRQLDFVVGWDRIVRAYCDKECMFTQEVSVYEIHALLELHASAILVVGNGLCILKVKEMDH